MKLEVTSAPSFVSSAFPRQVREGQETLSDGRDIFLPPGLSIPDYIRLVYGQVKVEGIVEYFPFLNRDDKEKRYAPEVTDKFVFNGRGSIAQFHSSAKLLLSEIAGLAKTIDLPLVMDEDRKMMVPNDDALMSQFDSNPSSIFNAKDKARINDMGYLLSNADIMKKASLQRTVTPGWWAVSYDGKNAPNLTYFSQAVEVLVEAMRRITKGAQFSSVYDSTLSDQGDPLDTTIGFPLYSAEMTKEGHPMSKLRMLEQYKGLPCAASDWGAVVAEIKKRGTTEFQRNYPFAIAPIRRIQPGYKWAHQWRATQTGFNFVCDVRGNSTNRVAWMAPYLLNLLLSPVQTHWKAIRKLMPGLFHDGATRLANLKVLKTTSPFLLESDFSNYDRTIPVDVISHFFEEYSRLTSRPSFWKGALEQTQRNIPLVWPDHVSGQRGKGWVFTPKSLALLSGLKITSEIGTFMNLLINIAGWLSSGYKSRSAAVDYLVSGPIPSKLPEVLIQSDDTLLIDSDAARLKDKADAFRHGSKMAGIKATVTLGDKFLMRHMTDGADSPVASRVWQNTLNNEDPVSDPFIFAVGAAVRTDGLLGYKSSDPFATGKLRPISAIRLKYEARVVEQLLTFTKTAATPNSAAIKMLTTLLQSAEAMKAVTGDGSSFKMSAEFQHSLDEQRRDALSVLAAHQLQGLKSGLDAFTDSLRKNANSPSSALLLDFLLKTYPDLAKRLSVVEGKEHDFYAFAMKKLGHEMKIELK